MKVIDNILDKIYSEHKLKTGYKPVGLLSVIYNIFASRLFEYENKLKHQIKQMFISTADEEYLKLLGGDLLDYNYGSLAKGYIRFISGLKKDNYNPIHIPSGVGLNHNNKHYITTAPTSIELKLNKLLIYKTEVLNDLDSINFIYNKILNNDIISFKHSSLNDKRLLNSLAFKVNVNNEDDFDINNFIATYNHSVDLNEEIGGVTHIFDTSSNDSNVKYIFNESVSSYDEVVRVHCDNTDNLITGKYKLIKKLTTNEALSTDNTDVFNSGYEVVDVIVSANGFEFTTSLKGIASNPEYNVNFFLMNYMSSEVATSSLEIGSDNNKLIDTNLTFLENIDGVHEAKITQMLTGCDKENIDDYRVRLKNFISKPQGFFSKSHIEAVILDKVKSIKWLWIRSLDDRLNNNYYTKVTIFALNKLNYLSKYEKKQIKEAIIDIIPLNMSINDIVIKEPLINSVDLNILNITPYSDKIAKLVTSNILNYYKEPLFEEAVSEVTIKEIVLSTMIDDNRYIKDCQIKHIGNIALTGSVVKINKIVFTN